MVASVASLGFLSSLFSKPSKTEPPLNDNKFTNIIENNNDKSVYTVNLIYKSIDLINHIEEIYKQNIQHTIKLIFKSIH